jgi:predicted phosphodiesterase
MVTCQLLSDVHLEFYDGRPNHSRDVYISNIIKASKYNHSKYLFLAGDIGNNVSSVKHFIQRCLTEGPWQQIFYIAGNHEYYGKVKPLPKAIDDYKSIEKQLQHDTKSCHYLHHERLVLPEMVVMGATLWTRPSVTSFDGMNDGNKIRGKRSKLILSEVVEMHIYDKQYLSNMLSLPDELIDDGNNDNDGNNDIDVTNRKPIVVMTHHAPSFKLSLTGKDMYSSGYYCDADSLLEQADYWLYGHTHTPVNTTLYDCKVYSNPLGYPDELVRNYNFTFDVHTTSKVKL